MAHKTGPFLNILTSGKQFDAGNDAGRDQQIRYIMLNSVIFLGCTLLTTFGIESLRNGLQLQGIFDLALASMTVITFIVLRTNAPYRITAFAGFFPYLCLYGFLAQSGGIQGSGVLWSFSFPLLAIFLLGMRAGTVLSLVLLAVDAVCLFVPGVSPFDFSLSFGLRTVGVYILILACTIIYEQQKTGKDRWLARLNHSLQQERDEIAAMKDNLKVGLFLMDGDLLIQGQYSPAMGGIFNQSDLAGKSFMDLVGPSLAAKDAATLRDYFGMVLKRSFDPAMLEEINPLQQFTWLGGPDGQEKVLRCGFAAIERGQGQVFILGTVEDQTREAELLQQLSTEEGRLQEQMKALFEVIHVEPSVLHDFIGDAEFEFDRINALLKNKHQSSGQVLVEIYQAIHAIKSNALILGLASFSAQLHQFEDQLHLLRRQAEPSFEEMLRVTVELERLMRVKDGFKENIKKIQSFNQGAGRLREETVLVQTLERIVDKAANAEGKTARLVVGEIDPQALAQVSRRVLKDVLSQLARNAVSHGIEAADERLAQGKSAQGTVSLSICRSADRLEIVLSDDGRGLDYAAIARKAREKGLIADQDQMQDQAGLLKLLFSAGFSTRDTADQHAGRGIGLNLVRDRIKELKGSIKVQSSAGKGTSFRLVLPWTATAGATLN